MSLRPRFIGGSNLGREGKMMRLLRCPFASLAMTQAFLGLTNKGETDILPAILTLILPSVEVRGLIGYNLGNEGLRARRVRTH
jgi:hypothetical protein